MTLNFSSCISLQSSFEFIHYQHRRAPHFYQFIVAMLRPSALLSSWAFLMIVPRCYVACAVKRTKMTLITFDVDGTLIHGTSSAEAASHAKAFSYGVGSIFAPDRLEEFRLQYPNPLSAITKENYHGSTDGLIALHFARSACGVSSQDAFPKLNDIFQKMFEFISPLSDSEMCKGIEVLPGVIQTLESLVRHHNFRDHLLCGLVTGNVEGIARKKMRASGILATKVFSKSAPDQQSWTGEEGSSFLGGFGSDYCSGDIDDVSRIYKDRGEQISIAYGRAKAMLRGIIAFSGTNLFCCNALQ